MRTKTLLIPTIFIAVLLVSACESGASNGGKPIKSASSGNLTITLASRSGEIRNGENDLTITFADTSGKPVEIGAASLNFHMPAMGSMPEMNNAATLTTTDSPGVYRARTHIEMAGTWEAQVRYQGPQGSGLASMTVNVK